MKTVGVISDTHGLLRAQAAELLTGCDLILHAGDIGKQKVLQALKDIAPVIAVRGNVDREPWAQELDTFLELEIAHKQVALIHNIAELKREPQGQFDVVVYGHSHQPVNEWRDGVLYFNPASAGPRRFKLPVMLGKLQLSGSGVTGELIELDPSGK